MSMIACNECGRIIDSDDDPDCFQKDALGKDHVLCEICREIEEMENDEERFRHEVLL